MAEVSVSYGPVTPGATGPATGNDGSGLTDKIKNIKS
jgi:hypothetical protein